MNQRTLCIVKPCAVRDLKLGRIINEIEQYPSGLLKIVAMKHLTMTTAQAAEFYKEHEGRPYYDGLIAHTTSGPCVAIVLEGPAAIASWRRWIGPTNPRAGNETNLRYRFGTGIPDNAFHGSDSQCSADREIGLLFPEFLTDEAQADFLEKVLEDCNLELVERQPLEKAPLVRFVRTDPAAVLPSRGTSGAAGWDVYAAERTFIAPHTVEKISTGWNVAVPAGYEMQVRARSGMAFKGIGIANGPGTVDEDYRGPLGILLVNYTDQAYLINPGDRIAQILIAPVQPVRMEEVEAFDDTTERGTGGYGSTGR